MRPPELSMVLEALQRNPEGLTTRQVTYYCYPKASDAEIRVYCIGWVSHKLYVLKKSGKVEVIGKARTIQANTLTNVWKAVV